MALCRLGEIFLSRRLPRKRPRGCVLAFPGHLRGEGTMAFKWKVSHPQRLIVAVSRYEVTAADVLFCAEEFFKVGLNDYRKLFDLTRLGLAMSPIDIHSVGRRLAAAAHGKRFGPVAIVVASDAMAGSAAIVQRAVTDREGQIFRDRYVARVWLDVTAPADQISQAQAPR
jgi:hypothetical protein